MLDWDRLSHSMAHVFRGDGYRLQLFKGLAYLRTEATERGETIVVLAVETEFSRQLVTRSILPQLLNQLQAEINGPLRVQFEVIGPQTSFPVHITDKPLVEETKLAVMKPAPAILRMVCAATDLSFETFIESASNTEALRAALLSVEAPEMVPSALVFTGPHGSGKTHLLHAIHVDCLRRGQRVKLISGEKFLTDFLEHVKRKESFRFQKKYRGDVDILIIDDVSCLRTAKKTQEELLALLVAFAAEGKRVVVSTPQTPREVEGFDPRLASVLGAGLVVRLEAPCYALKLQAVQMYLDEAALTLEDDALQALVENMPDDLRSLRGAANKIKFLFANRGEPVTAALLASYRLIPDPTETPKTPGDLLKAAARKFGIDIRVIESKDRSRRVTEARAYVMWRMRQDLRLSYAEIGRLIGHRNPSTVQHVIKKFEGAEPH